MSDYINREDTLKSMDTWDKFGCDGHGRLVPYTEDYVPYVKYDDMLKAVEGQPSADVAPVVRCKNCDYWNELEKGVGVCKRLVEAMWVDYTDFCSFAENKDDITYGEREDDESVYKDSKHL